MASEKRRWQPFILQETYCIQPANFQGHIEGRYVLIKLGDGKAFGSGEHETTRDCLDCMQAISFGSLQRVMDLGAGSGILAIAAAKLGADSVVALDIDSVAARTCQQNVLLNAARKQITTICGSLVCIRPDARFQVIIANLHGDIILALAERLVNALDVGGRLLLSGIAYEDVFEVKDTFSKWRLQMLRHQTGEAYNTFLFIKRAGPQSV